MRGAIVGFGFIAQGHLRGYRERTGLGIDAVVDPCAARREAALALGLRAYEDLDELIANGIPDFLDVCSPPNTHAAYITEALTRRVPAMVEKPVFVPGAVPHWDVVDEILKADLVVYPCSNYKFAPVFAQVRSRIAAGAVGEVESVRVRILRSGHARGVHDWQPDWRRDPTVSAGGILRDHGPHAIYLATSLTGLRPVSVSCIAGSMRDGRSVSNEDTVLLRVCCEGDKELEVCLSWASSYRDSHYVIAGTKGSLTVHNDDLVLASEGRSLREGISSEFDDASHSRWFAAMFDDFEALLRSPVDAASRLPGLLGEAALCSDVIDAGYTSAGRQGAWVPVETRPRW